MFPIQLNEFVNFWNSVLVHNQQLKSSMYKIEQKCLFNRVEFPDGFSSPYIDSLTKSRIFKIEFEFHSRNYSGQGTLTGESQYRESDSQRWQTLLVSIFLRLLQKHTLQIHYCKKGEWSEKRGVWISNSANLL